MSTYNNGKGSIGTSMTTIRVRNGREVKSKAPRRSDCKKCVHAIINGDCITCYITQEVAVNKQYCSYYRTADEPAKNHRKKHFRKGKRKVGNRYES